MPTQIKFSLPNGDFSVIDNSSAPTFPTMNANTHIGYDTTAPGATAQGTNPFADTGTVLLDSVNDTVYANPRICTVKGNPVAGTPPTFQTVTTVINNATTGVRVLAKNPA